MRGRASVLTGGAGPCARITDSRNKATPTPRGAAKGAPPTPARAPSDGRPRGMADDEWALLQAQQLLSQITGVALPAPARSPSSSGRTGSATVHDEATPHHATATSLREAQTADASSMEIRRVVAMRITEVFAVRGEGGKEGA